MSTYDDLQAALGNVIPFKIYVRSKNNLKFCVASCVGDLTRDAFGKLENRSLVATRFLRLCLVALKGAIMLLY